jgi:hypothetical protein
MPEYPYTPDSESKKHRFEALVKRWDGLQDAIRIRGSEYADDPIGSTGYFIRKFRVQGSAESPVVLEEYSLDIQLLRDLRSLEKEIAVRCGEWKSGVTPDEDLDADLNLPGEVEWEGHFQRIFDLLSPEQVQEYRVQVEALKAQAAAKPIANRELKTRPVDRDSRLAVLADRRDALLAAIRVRGMEFADDSFARTGYYSRQVKVRGNRGCPVLLREYSLDTQLLREIDAIDRQIAIERGEWGPFNAPTAFETPRGGYQESVSSKARSILLGLLTDEQNVKAAQLENELLSPRDERKFGAYVDQLVDSARKLNSNEDNVRRL